MPFVTEDVDVIVARSSLQVIHDNLEGLGCRPPFSGSKNLIDVVEGVKVDLVIAGGFPGDGKPKPVAFPDPAEGTVEINRVRYVTLEKLVELKMASGMSGGALRMKDLGDVVSIIHTLELPRTFGDKLDPSVRAKFDEFWVAWDADLAKDEF